MIYKGVEFYTERDSTTIIKAREFEVRSYPYTDKSADIEKGKRPTRISTTIIAMSNSEKDTILGLLNSSSSGELEHRKDLYKKVKVGEEVTPVPLGREGSGLFSIAVEFIALDPETYDSETGELKYAN